MTFRYLGAGRDFGGTILANVGSPASPTDGANKGYVDNLVAGLSWKDEVRVATTGNGTLATAFANSQTVDGQTLATNDRILIKNQTTQTENGIYTVNASGAPTRATDADTTAELNNATVFVRLGTTNGGKSFTQTTDSPTVGSSNIVFAAFNVGNVYTASTGLTLSTLDFQIASSAAGAGLTFTAGVLDVVGDASITVGANSLGLATGVAGAGLTLTSGVLAVTNTDTSVTVAADTVSVNPAAGGGLTVSSGLKVDTTIPRVFRQVATNVASTTVGVTHGLGTKNVISSVMVDSTGEVIECDVVNTSTSATTFTFGVAPTVNTLTFIIIG